MRGKTISAPFDKRAYVLGDNTCPFLSYSRFNLDKEKIADELRAFNFLIFGYFIPYDLLFDPEYCRWRLFEPFVIEFFKTYLAYYLSHKKGVENFGEGQEAVIKGLERKIERLNDKIAQKDRYLLRRTGISHGSTKMWITFYSRRVGA